MWSSSASEIEPRDERRIATSLKLLGLPPGNTLEDFDWTFRSRIDCTKLDALATCAFIRQPESVLFMEPPGVGKSHLAAFEMTAIRDGFSNQHKVLDDLTGLLETGRRFSPVKSRLVDQLPA